MATRDPITCLMEQMAVAVPQVMGTWCKAWGEGFRCVLSESAHAWSTTLQMYCSPVPCSQPPGTEIPPDPSGSTADPEDLGPYDEVEWIPLADVEESEHHFTIYLDLAGMPKESIAIEVLQDKDNHSLVDKDNPLLVVRGERKEPDKKPPYGRRRGQWPIGSFVRRWRIPRGVKVNEIKRTFADGTLTIQVPKRMERLEIT